MNKGKIIEEYFDDYPFPSILVAYLDGRFPLHVVVSYNENTNICYIITAYIPDEKHFKPDLITRKDDA